MYISLHFYSSAVSVLQLQLYLKTTCNYQSSTKRTGPQIAFPNVDGTVTLKDYNKNNK